MSKFFIKILLLLAFSLMFSACPKKNNSLQTGGILTFDETDKAGNEVKEANEMLKLIKQRFKENENRLEELQAAMKGKNPEKVREIADELVTQINAGTEVGEEAINKLRIAQEKNINEDYKEYLSLKIQALERYVEAFEERRQAAILLRDGYDPKNAAKRGLVIGAFTERENKFKEIVQSARELSEEANRLARESLNRKS
jgi:uncharacterized protein YpuA (DUF1002 family)